MATGQSTTSALAHYLAAKARHAEARRLLARAERPFARLSKGFDEYHERTLWAYEIAGVGLADQRSLKAYREEGEAFARLRATLRGGDYANQLLAFGAVACAELPPPANS
jgi:hypothetical protein